MFLSRLPRPFRLALYALAVGVILYLCLAPQQDVPGEGLLWDKAEHALAWAMLTTLGLILSPNRPRAIPLFCVALGAAVEVAQATMGFGRDGDIPDLVADSLGVAVAVLAWWVLRRARR